jgi:hypothetical protein
MEVQPYVLLSVMPRANQKPSFKYFGPFEILEKIGTAAYHQKLPDSSSIHPVVHVSQLKLDAGFTGPVTSALPSDNSQFHIPIKVLRTHMVDRGDHQVAQVLVQWSQLPPDLASWEDYHSLKQLFPAVPAWGQAGFKEGGHVSTSPSGKRAGPRRSTRAWKPNEFLSGSDWH